MLGENIKKYRKKLGLTQEALSRKTEISYNTITKLEAGTSSNPRMDTLLKLSEALEISVDKLIGSGK